MSIEQGRVSIEQSELDRWRKIMDRTRRRMELIERAIGSGERDLAGSLAQQTQDEAFETMHRMELAGAKRAPSEIPSPEVSLTHLASPANRRYMEALRAAFEAGKAVDAERYGPQIGTEGPAAGIIEMILWGVEEECCAPVGTLGE